MKIFREICRRKLIWKNFFRMKSDIKLNPIKINRINLHQIADIINNYIEIKDKIIVEPNIFKHVRPDETKHSYILSELLSPNGFHGKGDLFLKLFFNIISFKFSDTDIWEVTAEKGRYDIRIRSVDNSKIVIIENKSNNAYDQPNQLYRYWYYGIYLAQYKFKVAGIDTVSKLIYLSPNDFKQPDLQTVTRPKEFDVSLPQKVPINIDIIFFNEHIASWLTQCLNSVRNDEVTLKFYLQQYIDFWRQQ